jgi:hypothetical protein
MMEPTSVMNLQPNREPFGEIALIMGIGLQFMMNDELLMQETAYIKVVVAANC